ncbi:MAG: hypothetical protein N2654_00060 [Deltaproteobacteria bacterium]|nr:hypothetical protein [Deltaproteobacteria bacterium]
MIKKLFEEEFEEVVFFSNPRTNLECIIAVHSTKRGPALGGCRFWHYSSYEDALIDVLRLAKGMTYKAAAAGLDLGGGKSVIIKNPAVNYSRKELMRSFGECVNKLQGRYITAEDMGTTTDDMDVISEVTPFVRGCGKVKGDPSPFTAKGVFYAIQVGFRLLFGSEDVSGKTIAIQGLGAVGLKLAKILADSGSYVIGTDVSSEAVERAHEQINGIKIVSPEEIYKVDADCFSPCAGGAILNSSTIPLLKAKLVAGAANNQISSPECYELFKQKGILYAPDFLINSGGLIKVASETLNKSDPEDWINQKLLSIKEKLLWVFEEHIKSGKSTEQLAIQLAQSELA